MVAIGIFFRPGRCSRRSCRWRRRSRLSTAAACRSHHVGKQLAPLVVQHLVCCARHPLGVLGCCRKCHQCLRYELLSVTHALAFFSDIYSMFWFKLAVHCRPISRA